MCFSGCSVPFSCTLGSGICFRHGLSGIFISGKAVVGDNCFILHQVTIGSNYGSTKRPFAAPVVGNGVFIGAGAKIIGGVAIGARARIGANALVVEDVPEGAVCFAPKSLIKVDAEGERT
ncbi:serine acetyltransferase [Variovorax sp. UC122_21]|uniref:serine acetyltransferase n=1 Tax=Variovorax sp. UC122_21 TaxID=3374554 RepID=UPI0037570667